MRRTFPILFILFFTSALRAQNFSACEDSLHELYVKMLRTADDDAKKKWNDRLCGVLERTLEQQGSFEFPFDSLKKYKILLPAPDNSFRIFCWNMEMQDGTQKYSGYIQSYNKKKRICDLVKLNDRSDGMKTPENAACDKDNWFGAFYYKIIENRYKDKKYYTLLGWDGNDRITSKRLIDVLYFDSRGLPQFGDAVFKYEHKTVRRVILEYKAGVFVSLKYEEGKQRIIFDHLSPDRPELEGQYQFYGPDFSYDAFEFKKGKWLYKPEVEVKNTKKEEDKKYNTPH